MLATASQRPVEGQINHIAQLRQRVLLVGICALGLSLRLWGLTAESIWLDEATSFFIARLPPAEMLHYLSTQDIHPPLYFMLLHPWQALGSDALTLRSFSTLLGVLTLPVVYILSRELLDARAGLIGAFLLALSPLHVYYSQMVRMYALLVLVSALTFFALMRALRSGQKRWWGLYTLLAALSAYTHYLALLALAAQNLVALALLPVQQSPGKRFQTWLLANLGAGALLLPWALVLLAQGASAEPSWSVATTPPAITAPITTLSKFSLGDLAGTLPRWVRLATYGLCGLVIVSALFKRRRTFPYLARNRQRGVWIILAWATLSVLGVWVVSQVRPVYMTRYLVTALIPYLLLLAAGAARLRPNAARYAVLVGLVTAMGSGLWLQHDRLQVNDWRVASSYVLARARAGDVVVTTPPWYKKPFDYYAKGRVALLETPDDRFVPAQVCDDAPWGYSRLWLVQPHDKHHTDPTNSLATCLSARFDLVSTFYFPPRDARAYLYDVGASH